jgi:hypothetical protein
MAHADQLARALHESHEDLRPFFRALAHTLNAAVSSGQATVYQAKKDTRFSGDTIPIFEKAAKPNSSKSDLKLAFDEYWQLIVSSPDKAVKALTGKDRKWWDRLYRTFEKGD